MGLNNLYQVRRVLQLPLFCRASSSPFWILRKESCSTVMKPLLSILGSPTATDGRRPPRLATSGQINRGWNLSPCMPNCTSQRKPRGVAAEWATYIVDIKLYCSFNFFRCDFIHSAANSSIALSCLSTMHSSEGKEIQTRNLAYSVVCRNWDLGTTGEMDKTWFKLQN